MANPGSFCHIFLSFRGDTRNPFTCFLYEALKNEGFKVFMDEDAIRIGDELDSRIRQGIKSSLGAIVVLSKNYASSTWCLDELVLILERNKTSRYLIMPIFYDVHSEEIKQHPGIYHTALKKHEERYPDKVEKWRQAVIEVANIGGEHVQGRQSSFIQNIVTLFGHKLCAEFQEFVLPRPMSLAMPEANPSSSEADYTTALLEIDQPGNSTSYDDDTSHELSFKKCNEVCQNTLGIILTLAGVVLFVVFIIAWGTAIWSMAETS